MLSESVDINVSPDKRTIFVHSEDCLIDSLKVLTFHPVDVYPANESAETDSFGVILCTVTEYIHSGRSQSHDKKHPT